MSYTKLPGAPDRSDAVPGMAYFAGTGPAGKTCGHCCHRGMWRVSSIERWDDRRQTYDAKSYRYSGCAMFKQLTGKFGPAIARDNGACKYFGPKTAD